MADSVRSVLSRLEPISHNVILTPLREDEIRALEAAVGLPLPSCAREYFRIVGLFQDFTDYEASEYEVFDNLEQFRESRQFLVKNFGPAASNLFPFADDGAGNIVAVAEEPGGGALFFADHEMHKISEIGPFCDWLSSAVDSALKDTRSANREKKWCVQFSFRVSSPDSILEVMRQFGKVSLGKWSKAKISESNVHSSEAPLAFAEERLTLKRSEYWTWEQPMFSLDYSEPTDLAASASVIRKLDAAFSQASLSYKLVDYGPLSPGPTDKAPVVPPTKSPWTKFRNWFTRHAT